MISLSKTEQNRLKNVQFIDLFAGIGGFHLALTSFGATCVFASEINAAAAQVYYKNFHLLPKGDITQIDASKVPEHDILCAGFPCQAFSISGKQAGFEDVRGTLFFDIVRIAKAHQPKVLLLENVKNFKRHDGGKTLKTVVSILKNLNYSVFYEILNAAQFNLPQKRERIYFVAFRNDLKVSEFQFPIPQNATVTLRNILESDEKTLPFRIDRTDISWKEKITTKKHQPIRIGTVNKGGQGERIYAEHGLAITLSAYGGGVGAKTGLYKINGILRKLSPRECARLQGFPESFHLADSVNQAYQQFGNAVPVNVVQAILQKLPDVF